MKENRITKNVLALFMGNAVVNLFSFLLMVVIARSLGDIGVGQYSFIFAFGYLIILLGNPGLEYLIVKEVPGNKNMMPQYGANLLSLKIILATLAVAITILLSFLIDKKPLVIYSFLIVCLIYGFRAVGSIFSKILQAHERMDLISLVEVVERVLALILGIVLLYVTRSLLYLLLALLISRLISEILSLKFSKKYFTPNFGVDLLQWKDLFVRSLPFSLSIAFLYIYYRIDTVMLYLMVNDQVTGWYNAAYRVIDVFNYIPFLFVTAILPPMARYSKQDKKLLSDLFNLPLRYLIVLAVPMGVGTFLLAPRIILFVYGEGFENAAIALKILIWAEVIVFVSYLGGHLLNIGDKQKTYTKFIGITAGLNIVLNFILIPKYTYIGASIATLLCELLIVVLIYNSVKKHFFDVDLWSSVWRPILCSIAMGIIIIQLSFLPLWYVVPIGIISYFILFFLLGGFNKQDKDTFLSILSMMRLKRA
jgi:O-antigen/teichoic acid export membrane protein